MKKEEFYHAFANTPLNKQRISLGAGEGEEKFECMYDIYKQLEDIGDWIRTLQTQQDELLERAEKGFKNLK